jgi:succinate dehydrogenase / fumarate reductase membrane anchor subunit
MKSATGLTGSGSRDWYIQRVSAVVLAVYTVVVLGWILCNGGFNYEQWFGFMMTLPMKILSLLAVLSLVAHAWIGMWQVFTDYVTTRQMGPSASGLRIVLTSAVIIAVIAYAIWAIQIFLGELIGRCHGRFNP